MQMWATLTYRFMGMTEKINGAFMDDFGELNLSGQSQDSSARR